MGPSAKREPRRRFPVALTVVLPLLLGLAGLGAASMPVAAATGSGATPQDVTYNVQYRLASDSYQGQFSGDWVVCVYATASSVQYSIGCSYSVTVTAEVSGDAGFSYGTISAEVGFNVSYSTTAGSNADWTIQPNELRIRVRGVPLQPVSTRAGGSHLHRPDRVLLRLERSGLHHCAAHHHNYLLVQPELS